VHFADDLEIIPGVSTKTIQDIKRVYDDENEFIYSLSEDRVSLRDDVVKKLKKYYDIE